MVNVQCSMVNVAFTAFRPIRSRKVNDAFVGVLGGKISHKR